MSTDSEHRYALPPGHRLGEYRIERYLGSGGFGITYLATVGNLGLQVAIKEYLPSDLAMRDAGNSVVVKTAGDQDDFRWGRERFLDEARSLARFNHPNIVRVQRFFEAHGTSYIVMDYVEGEPLSERLRRRGTLTEAEIRQQVLPLSDGLAEIHAAGLLHRDIKPSNIIIRKDGTPVLIDFGSARQAVGAKSRSVTSVVTPGYAPIEQYSMRGKQGPGTDIYALGAVLYRCVTGKVPNDAANRVIDDRLIPAAEAVKDDYSAGLLAGIDAALAVRMEERPSDVAAFLSGLGEGGAKTPHIPHREQAEGLSESERVAIQDTPGSAKQQTRYGQRLYVLLASGLVLMVFIGLGLLVFREAQENETGTDAQQLLEPLAEQIYDGNEADLTGAEDASDVEAKRDLESALEAYDWGDYPTALREFLRLAEQGHVRAQYNLGVMYANGYGVPQDDAQASSWYRKAAEQGDAEAQYYLGIMYNYGRGVFQDSAQAANWYRKAAKRGYTEAQNKLGNMYFLGSGVPRDRKQAANWHRKAAEQGHAEAQYHLGFMYANGYGVPQDDVQAYAWYNLSVTRGEEAAGTSRENLGTRMTPSQISEAQALSHDLETTIQR